jgi:3-oxoacyl-[acyl-carrier-protein] synthase-1
MNDIVVVALGARTPLGLTAEASAAAVRAGISRVREHPFMIDPAGEPLRTAMDCRLDPALLGWKRLAPLATSALFEAIGKAFSDRARIPALSAFLSLPEERAGFSNDDALRVVRDVDGAIHRAGLGVHIQTARRGHAGALDSMGAAIAQLRAGRCAAAVVGGVDSYLDADTLDALAADQRLAAEGVRSGFFPGEAAGFAVWSCPDFPDAQRSQ